MKLTNKDKRLIRQALFNQVENLIFAIGDENSGYHEDLQYLTQNDNWAATVTNYCYKIIGLYPV